MRRTFAFGLQPLLDLRARVEEEKQRDFAACRRALDASRHEVERLAKARQRCTKELAESARARSAVDLRLRDAHLRYLERAVDAQRRRAVELQADCERSRQELMAASRERRVIEKLKERQRILFEAEEARREELELEDANARRHERAARERRARAQAGRAAP
jgi:flagellar protein FliJ